MLRKQPKPRHLSLFGKNVAGVIFFVAGDAIMQQVEYRLLRRDDKPSNGPADAQAKTIKDENWGHDPMRSVSMALGGIYFGTVGHFWTKNLDKWFPVESKKKIICDLIMMPPFAAGLFSAVGYVEGKPMSQSFEQFKHNIIYFAVAAFCYDRFPHTTVFIALPPKTRAVVTLTVTLAYNMFLSYLMHREIKESSIMSKIFNRLSSDS